MSASCPDCDGQLEILTRSTPDPFKAGMVTRCLGCKVEWLIKAEMLRVAEREPRLCGTDAGYRKHRRRNEDACSACREAHASYESRRRVPV